MKAKINRRKPLEMFKTIENNDWFEMDGILWVKMNRDEAFSPECGQKMTNFNHGAFISPVHVSITYEYQNDE